MSKGTVTIAPYHANRQLMSPVAVAGLLVALVSFLDVKSSAWPTAQLRDEWYSRL